MNRYILGLEEVNKSSLALAGGKGANLGELLRVDQIQVPAGFCISTEAFRIMVSENDKFTELLEQLDTLKADNMKAIGEISAKIRRVIEGIPVSKDIREEIENYLKHFNETESFAVRSSATAEDLPSASFAGQQDTFLNIVGKDAVINHARKCWASLFTDRAIIYRIQNGFDHRKVSLAVIVQKMIFPETSGILFTADPITGNRKILSIDASFGLGEALVGGLVNSDNYKLRDGRIIDKNIPTKKRAIYAVKDGGTKEQEIEPGTQNKQALSDEQILKLEQIGRKIEKHFGYPQDIEWCLADNTFYIVQSRPITTLYPIPDANDQENHVYVSVGHQQMMTDPIKPLGLSFFRATSRAHMRIVGGRLFVDVTAMLASAAGRETILNVLGKSDPLIKDALTSIVERGDFIQPLPADSQEKNTGKNDKGMPAVDYKALHDHDLAVVFDLIKQSEKQLDELKQNIRTKSGTGLIDFIREDIQKLPRSLSDPRSMEVIMTAMNASFWINEKIYEWLGEKNAADVLTQSAPNNITSEMGLALLDVADVIRPYPGIVKYLQQVKDDNYLNELPGFDGGQEARDAIQAFLDKYGMRCAGEIDITNPRWSEKPTTLIPVILNNVKNFEQNSSKRKFEQGQQEALKKEKEIIERLKQLPGGEQKAKDTKRMIDLVRNLSGYREYPKYFMISCYFVYKQALLKEAEQLVKANVIHDKEDIYYLTLEELYEVIQTGKLDYTIITKRKDEYKLYEKLTPPRIITSDGEIITGKYKRENIPANAIIGLPVSSGIVEGRARVIFNIEDAAFEEGDILITKFTDPSWTPLFVSIKGLVTEVGGLMTHGAVIAREYGLPAVVGVENVTKLIKDGERIRVNGTDGYIEIL